MVKNSHADEEPQETWVRSLGQEDSLQKEMATHSSILAGIILQTEEPGRLQSMGSQRIRHNWVHTHSSDAPLSKLWYKIIPYFLISCYWSCFRIFVETIF